MTRVPITACLCLLALACRPQPAAAHDVTFDLQGSGQARVLFRYQDGAPMAGADYAIFAPDAQTLPGRTGLTDAAGAVPVQATQDGLWRIDVRDGAGHAARARLRVSHGLVTVAGLAVPDWAAAISLAVNLVLGSVLALRWRLRRATRAPVPRHPQPQGSSAT